jgi:hypothetical protein
MKTIANAVEAVLRLAVLSLAPLVMLAFWSYVTEVVFIGGW